MKKIDNTQLAKALNQISIRSAEMKVTPFMLKSLGSMMILKERATRATIGKVSDNATMAFYVVRNLLEQELIDKEVVLCKYRNPNDKIYGYKITPAGEEVYDYIINGRKSATK
tara:strand:- start:1240 stop:1578 length:339 start_codon:yes stop_codon:yes gene_type:complete